MTFIKILIVVLGYMKKTSINTQKQFYPVILYKGKCHTIEINIVCINLSTVQVSLRVEPRWRDCHLLFYLSYVIFLLSTFSKINKKKTVPSVRTRRTTGHTL